MESSNKIIEILQFIINNKSIYGKSNSSFSTENFHTSDEEIIMETFGKDINENNINKVKNEIGLGKGEHIAIIDSGQKRIEHKFLMDKDEKLKINVRLSYKESENDKDFKKIKYTFLLIKAGIIIKNNTTGEITVSKYDINIAKFVILNILNGKNSKILTEKK